MKFTVASKSITSASTLIIMTHILLGWIFVNHETKAIHGELNERVNIILSNFAYDAQSNGLLRDKTALEALIGRTIIPFP